MSIFPSWTLNSDCVLQARVRGKVKRLKPEVSAPLSARFERSGTDPSKTLKPVATVRSRKRILMHLLFLAAVHHASAAVAQACPMSTPKSEIAADVITGLLTLGFGILILRLPPERRKPTRG